ncbi:hypothetical protein W97_00127 [Neofusicoccum parvum]|uniref:Uncharacterized protein n=1 Tax=Neofusicoccum parvum TaxID=310453 RepID=A0ACB5RNU3_9PEZI|nr:hypothetical protein W97_00127 [Neofusicoccum parvum]
MASLKIQPYDYDEDTMKCVVPPPVDLSQQDGMKYFVRRKPLSDEPLPHQEDPIAFPRGSDQEPPIPLPADHELPMAIHGLDDPIPLSMEDTSTNIIWTAQKIVRHWNQREWEKADAQLQQQLSDVAQGVTIEIKGLKRAPEQRLLRFLLGVSASLQGQYGRAKQWFDGVLARPYRFGMPMDEGDIAAARWLGDACLMLNEPHNAALAYTIAIDAQTNNLGSTPERDRLMNRTLADLREVQMKMKGLTRLQHAFEQMDDISNIYPTTDPFVKGRLVHEMMIQPRWLRCDQLQARMPSSIQIDEGYLIHPMITFAKWPVQWDPFFNAKDAVQIHCDLQNIPAFPSSAPRFALNPAAIPTTPLGQSGGLDFVTKRDAGWLVEAVRNALLTHGLEYVERPDYFIVRLHQRVERVALHETLVVKLRRLAMRKTFGVKVAAVRNRSRSVALTAPVRREFADVVKAALVVAEAEASAAG